MEISRSECRKYQAIKYNIGDDVCLYGVGFINKNKAYINYYIGDSYTSLIFYATTAPTLDFINVENLTNKYEETILKSIKLMDDILIVRLKGWYYEILHNATPDNCCCYNDELFEIDSYFKRKNKEKSNNYIFFDFYCSQIEITNFDKKDKSKKIEGYAIIKSKTLKDGEIQIDLFSTDKYKRYIRSNYGILAKYIENNQSLDKNNVFKFIDKALLNYLSNVNIIIDSHNEINNFFNSDELSFNDYYYNTILDIVFFN